MVEARWQSVLDAVRAQKVALGSFLQEGWPTKVGGGQLEIMFGRESSFQMSAVENNRLVLQEIVTAILGTPLRLLCVKDEEGILPRVRKIPALTDRKSEFEKKLQADAWMQKIVQEFDAEFIK
jgi:hypothetical protein